MVKICFHKDLIFMSIDGEERKKWKLVTCISNAKTRNDEKIIKQVEVIFSKTNKNLRIYYYVLIT